MHPALFEVGAGVTVTSASDADLHAVGHSSLEDDGDVHVGVWNDNDGRSRRASGVHHLPPVLVAGTGGEEDLA